MSKEYGIAEFYVAQVNQFADGVYRFWETDDIDDHEPWFTTDDGGHPVIMTGSLGVWWRGEWYEELAGEFDKVNLEDWYKRGRHVAGGFSVVYALVESEFFYELDGYPPTNVTYRIVGLVDLQHLLADTAQRLRDGTGAE